MHRTIPSLATITPAVVLLTALATAQTVPIAAIYRLDDGSGLIARDLGPFTNDGTLMGYGTSGTWTTGQYRGALQFDGVDDYVDIPPSPALPIYRGDGSPFSIAFWVKAPASDDDRVYSEGNDQTTTLGGALFTIGTGRTRNNTTDKLQVYIRDDSLRHSLELYSASTVFDDTWHHVAYVDVAGDARLYVDGVLDGNSFDYRNLPNFGPQTPNYGSFSTNRISLGAVLRSNVVAHLACELDELHVFAYALTPGDVQTLRMDTIPTTCRPSVAEFGLGCGTPNAFDLTATGTGAIGTSVTISGAGGPPGAAAILLFDIGRAPRLDLTPFNFPGCTAYVANPTAIPVGTLDPSGNLATFPVPIPNSPLLACIQVNVQGLATDPVTLVTSDVVQIFVGN